MQVEFEQVGIGFQRKSPGEMCDAGFWTRLVEVPELVQRAPQDETRVCGGLLRGAEHLQTRASGSGNPASNRFRESASEAWIALLWDRRSGSRGGRVGRESQRQIALRALHEMKTGAPNEPARARVGERGWRSAVSSGKPGNCSRNSWAGFEGPRLDSWYFDRISSPGLC